MEQVLDNSKKSIGKALSKLPNAGIEKRSDIFKKPPQIIEITWQTYRILGFIFFGLSFAVMKYIVDHFEKKIDDDEIMSVLKIVSFFFILNFGAFLFMNVYYKYRKSVKGVKGAKGDAGIRGPQGSANHCNICKVKSGGFKKERKTPKQKEIIEKTTIYNFETGNKNVWKGFVNPSSTNQATYHINIEGQSEKSFIIMNPDTIGVGGVSDECTHITPVWLGNGIKKPIIGVSASINSNTGELYSIMYFYDGNKKHSKNRYKYTPSLESKIGIDDKKGDGVEFRAPKNSAVYKVTVFDNGSIIKAVRFYCADITTGAQVKVLDPLTNKMRKYANIGIAIDENDQTINSQTVSCNKLFRIETGNHTRIIQPFLSQVSGYKSNKHVCALSFLGACYLSN